MEEELRNYAESKGLDPEMFNTETHEIVCSSCGVSPRLVHLDKNTGTVVQCDCDGPKYSLDSVPYEYSIYDLPESWESEKGDN